MASVLILEDDFVFAGLVANSLHNAGHDVDVVGEGQSALAHVRQKCYDVLLVDMYIKVDGQYSSDGGLLLITRVRTQRQSDRFATPRHVQIIAMSGAIYQLGNQHILSTAQSLGADEVLGKPFAPNALLRMIAEAETDH